MGIGCINLINAATRCLVSGASLRGPPYLDFPVLVPKKMADLHIRGELSVRVSSAATELPLLARCFASVGDGQGLLASTNCGIKYYGISVKTLWGKPLAWA